MTLSLSTQFAPAPADLLAARELQQRIDHKFVVSADQLDDLTGALVTDYAVVTAGGSAIATYENRYFDTSELQAFHDHRRGRRLRAKTRIRGYPERALAFLEIKHKRGTLTTKHRRPLHPGALELGDDDRAWLASELSPYHVSGPLGPVADIRFRRLTLLHTSAVERVTIDFELTARTVDGRARHDFGRLAIVEIKRALDRPRTAAITALAAIGARPGPLSKYCLAMATLDPSVRHNRLRPDLRVAEALR